MGRVYLASDPELVRDVAIKVLRLDQAGSAKDAHRPLPQRARRRRASTTPNVVSVHDAGSTRTRRAHLEYILGSMLRDARPRAPRHRHAPPRCAGVRGARRLHAARIVHRDVKPDNILPAPTAAWEAHRTSGIAQVPDVALTRDGQFLGTPGVRGGEAIARGGTATARPSPSPPSPSGARRVRPSPATTPSPSPTPSSPIFLNPTLANGIPVGVDDVFSAPLSKEPEERRASAVEFADAPPRRSSQGRAPGGPLDAAAHPAATQTPCTVAKKPEQSIAPPALARRRRRRPRSPPAVRPRPDALARRVC